MLFVIQVTASHNGSKYTLTIVNAPQLTRGSTELLEKNADAAIKYLADNIRWQGVLDFVIYWDREKILGDYWSAEGPGFAAWGDHLVMAGLEEATTGIDINGEAFDAGMWVGPDNTSIADYGEDIYIDPDPNPLDDDIESLDFLSIFLHECLHGLGIWSNLQHREYDPVIPPSRFDSLTEKIGDQWFFIGEKTQEIYGSSVPLALSGSRDHYSDSLPYSYDLMREAGYPVRWQISDLDLAILYDLGHDVIKWSSERTPDYESDCSNSTDVFRFFNRGTGVHFFTPSTAEKDDIISKPEWGYKYEGVAYKAPTDIGTELYRFYNRSKGYHFLTASAVEADFLTGKPEWGYRYEGRSYKVSHQETSETPNEVHRFYNSVKGIHFYTASHSEASNIIANSLGGEFDLSNARNENDLLVNGWGYIYEGIAWYATDC